MKPLAAFVVVASLAAPRTLAQTVSVPPVVVNSLAHEHFPQGMQTITRDSVQFPCTGGDCNGPGFTASIGQGDTVVVRYEAPAGSRFRVILAPGGTQYFWAWAFWFTGTGDVTSTFPAGSIIFENLTGTPPTQTYALNAVSDNGEAVTSEHNFTVTGDFSFTAMQVSFPVPQALAHVSRTYGSVDSYSAPSFGSSRVVVGAAGDAILMQIEPDPPGTPFCPGDGTLIACPCANDGAPARGCENSSTTGGARLSSAGTTNPDTVVLTADGEKPTALSIFLQGKTAIAPVHYGDGLRCVGGTLKRLYAKNAAGGVVSAPGPGDPSIQTRSAQLGDTILPGETRTYMTYYRDASPAYCPAPAGSTFNGSSGQTIAW